MTRIRRAAAVLAAAAVLLTAGVRGDAATLATDYGSGTWGGPVGTAIQDPGWASPTLRVGLVGDSIAVRCASTLRGVFTTAGVTVAVRARSGQNTGNANDWLTSLTYKPDYLVFLTGTNDVFDPSVMPAQIARTKTMVPSGTTLVWADTYVARKTVAATVREQDRSNSGWVNQAVHSMIPAGHVIDWNQNIRSTVGRGGQALVDYYVPDGVHPSATGGCANYAEIVMQTMRPLLGLPGKRATR